MTERNQDILDEIEKLKNGNPNVLLDKLLQSSKETSYICIKYKHTIKINYPNVLLFTDKTVVQDLGEFLF